MPTRTAPDISVSPVTSQGVTLHLIDASGDIVTEYIPLSAAQINANIENWAADYQAATQSSLYGISVQSNWFGDADASNADVAQRNSVKDGVNLLFKNPSELYTYNQRLIAPIAAVMQGNQDIPLLSATAFTDLILSYQTMIAGWTLYSAQYTERRERKNNPRVVT